MLTPFPSGHEEQLRSTRARKHLVEINVTRNKPIGSVLYGPISKCHGFKKQKKREYSLQGYWTCKIGAGLTKYIRFEKSAKSGFAFDTVRRTRWRLGNRSQCWKWTNVWSHFAIQLCFIKWKKIVGFANLKSATPMETNISYVLQGLKWFTGISLGPKNAQGRFLCAV